MTEWQLFWLLILSEKKIVSSWIKQTLKQILSRMLMSYMAKKQTYANILEHMINQVLF